MSRAIRGWQNSFIGLVPSRHLCVFDVVVVDLREASVQRRLVELVQDCRLRLAETFRSDLVGHEVRVQLGLRDEEVELALLPLGLQQLHVHLLLLLCFLLKLSLLLTFHAVEAFPVRLERTLG